MTSPTFLNVLRDPTRDITYRVLAYRALTHSELRVAVALYLRSRKNKQPKAGSTVEIVSVIGFDE